MIIKKVQHEKELCPIKSIIIMQTTINQRLSTPYFESVAKPSVFTRFFKWCTNQEKNRLMWIGIALTAHGCILTPITVAAVLLTGNNFVLFMMAISAMGLSLVTNLAAMPTKITIPAFIFSILIDASILIASLVPLFDN